MYEAAIYLFYIYATFVGLLYLYVSFICEAATCKGLFHICIYMYLLLIYVDRFYMYVKDKYTCRPRMEKSHSKRHEPSFRGMVRIFVVITITQK